MRRIHDGRKRVGMLDEVFVRRRHIADVSYQHIQSTWYLLLVREHLCTFYFSSCTHAEGGV